MTIGVLRELKPDERRVAMTPEGVHEAVRHDIDVVVETGAAAGIGLTDDDYAAAGARIAATPDEVFERGQLLVHVKEPNADEIALLRPDHVLFTYLHLAAYPKVAEGLLATGCTAIGYETVTGPDGGLPLLAPMSRIAGRVAVQEGAHHLTAPMGGKGMLLGGDAATPPATVVVLGAGSVGQNAADVAIGLGAQVVILDLNLDRLEQVRERWGNRVATEHSTLHAVRRWVAQADLIVGAVLVAGARTPVIVTEDMLGSIEDGTVLTDISIDQGGCFETSRETTHHEPTYVVDGVLHYAVGNIPGAVPRTSTRALTAATLPYVLALAGGTKPAISSHPGLGDGVNIAGGSVVNPSVAAALHREPVPLTAVGL